VTSCFGLYNLFSYSSKTSRYVSGWINGFDRNWWSEKHNHHHVLTNHVTLDPDIHNQPFLFLWAPPKAVDHHLRRYQHYYFLPLYCFLYVSWRTQSFQFAWAHRDYKTLIFSLLPSYIWLLSLPLAVSVGSMLLGGLLVALVVTLSHESEEMLFEREPSYTINQLKCTRDIVCPDPITEYLFGGMQYQLEHHLFPTLPRYKYPQVRSLVDTSIFFFSSR
jgi:fatty acid desaturase